MSSHSVSFSGREGQRSCFRVRYCGPEDGMEKVYEKLDTLFLEDINQLVFLAYETFEGYQRQPDTSIEDFLINFGQHVAKLKDLIFFYRNLYLPLEH